MNEYDGDREACMCYECRDERIRKIYRSKVNQGASLSDLVTCPARGCCVPGSGWCQFCETTGKISLQSLGAFLSNAFTDSDRERDRQIRNGSKLARDGVTDDTFAYQQTIDKKRAIDPDTGKWKYPDLSFWENSPYAPIEVRSTQATYDKVTVSGGNWDGKTLAQQKQPDLLVPIGQRIPRKFGKL